MQHGEPILGDGQNTASRGIIVCFLS